MNQSVKIEFLQTFLALNSYKHQSSHQEFLLEYDMLFSASSYLYSKQTQQSLIDAARREKKDCFVK